MCELMAMAFAKPIHADFSIREFAVRGRENADGWGMARYPDQSVAIIKEPRPWHVSPFSEFLTTYQELRSRLCLAHVRHKTVGGEPTHADTHPFAREWNGRDYCFAHNGTVRQILSRPTGRFRPVGATDSEHLFCWLLDKIAQRGRHLDAREDWDWLHEHLVQLNGDEKLNCLMSDGQHMFCYFDRCGHKGLSYRPVYLQDEHRAFGDETVSLELSDDLFNYGIVVASNPLSESGWKSFETTELMVLAKGKIAYSSHRRDKR
jgi:glutamine amidotransferase